MSLRIAERPQARLDFWTIVDHLAVESVPTAERFIAAVEASQKFLANFPMTGTLIEDDDLTLKNLRVWQVKGFRNYLIVFRPYEDRVEILHYVYASRDLTALLSDV